MPLLALAFALASLTVDHPTAAAEVRSLTQPSVAECRVLSSRAWWSSSTWGGRTLNDEPHAGGQSRYRAAQSMARDRGFQKNDPDQGTRSLYSNLQPLTSVGWF